MFGKGVKSSQRRSGVALVGYALRYLLYKPAGVLLVFVLLTAAALLANIYSAVENNVSYPYRHMDSKYVVTYQTDGESVANMNRRVGLRKHGVNNVVVHCDVYIEAENGFADEQAHVVAKMDDEYLRKTQYGPAVKTAAAAEVSGVLIDRNLGRRVNVNCGDAVKLVQRDTGTVLDAVVCGFLEPYSDVCGIVIDAKAAKSLRSNSVSVYTDSLEKVSQISTKSLDCETISKDEISQVAKMRAKSILPLLGQNVQMWLSALLGIATSTMYSLLCWGMLERAFIVPLRCVGAARRVVIFLYVCATGAIVAATSVCAVCLSMAILSATMLYEPYCLEVLGTVVLMLTVCLIPILTVAAIKTVFMR